ncbi:ABC transporter permease [Nocardioides marmoriginsengisoli]|uniref:ABC transporter permease n=1 Tax=Nocardioides marmoriginsengisoli TaxID=661483 RepID=A0A3N0CH62_9ACTN|nr:ABC transporter permease [Nocardioides marmoriginsengisoli]RNL62787.1 ABC transporter permease [Nocardioides marmoriginsengisoli]
MSTLEESRREIVAEARARQIAVIKNIPHIPGNVIYAVGQHMNFYAAALAGIPLAVTRYRREVVRLIAAIAFGTGALVLVGGTVFVVAFLTGFAGVELGLQGYSQLGNIGVEALTGFISAYINTRLAAPALAGIALTATVGAGFTAQLGAMRVSEEIDALEVMSIHSVPYLVSTRIVAGLIAIIPIYSVSLLASYATTRAVVTLGFGQSSGAYSHYFDTFLIPSDIVISFIKVLFMAIVIMAISCYYGFNASGGPAGVGRAVGSAVRLSLVVVLFTDMLLSFALYGSTDTLNISG